MGLEQRGSAYRYRKQYKGKTYRLTFDHKPTEKEITIAMAKALSETATEDIQGTMAYFAKQRIDKLRKDGKSATTLNAYNSIVTNTPEWFLKENISDINSKKLQKVVDEYSKDRKPKTVSNFYGFYRSILADFRPDSAFKVNLPIRGKRIVYEPTTKDIKAILEYIKGSEYELFFRLASIGLRRGEIGALSYKDISSDDILTINKDMIKNENNEYVIKNHPKTTASNRRILIPHDVADMLRENKVAYSGHLDSPNKYLQRTLEKLDIPRFNLHIFRHFAAAYMVKNKFTKEQILSYMGWEKGSNVMDRVYSYNLDPEDSQKEIVSAFDSLV